MPAAAVAQVVDLDPLQLLRVNARVVALAEELESVCNKTLKIVEAIETKALVQAITLEMDALGNEVAQACGLLPRDQHEITAVLQSVKTLIELMVTDHAEDLWNARRRLMDEFLAILEEFDGHSNVTGQRFRGIAYDTIHACLQYVAAVDDSWIKCMTKFGEEYGVTIEDRGETVDEAETDGFVSEEEDM